MFFEHNLDPDGLHVWEHGPYNVPFAGFLIMDHISFMFDLKGSFEKTKSFVVLTRKIYLYLF